MGLFGSKTNTVEAATEFVQAAYERLLLRPADPAGLEHWRKALIQRPAAARELMDYLLNSAEFSSVARRFIHKYAAPQTWIHDNSQNGEVSILLREMTGRSVKHKIAVDVGAFGRSGSNTYDLLRHFGWRGVLVEPNPQRHAIIKDEFAGCDFVLVEMAAAGEAGTATLHFGVDAEITSIHRQSTEHWGPVHATCEVSKERLPAILANNEVPWEFGLLSVDAEGEGLNLIDDAFDAGYRPTWLILEVYKGLEIASLDDVPLSEAVKSRYQIVGKTFANLILELKT